MQLKEKTIKSIITKIVISATFTAEPLGETLEFWLAEIGLPTVIEFAPYNQVFQQLLDPISSQQQNKTGINLILLRIEDWEKEETKAGAGEVLSETGKNHLQQTLSEFITALKTATQNSSTSYLICFCPPSTNAVADSERVKFYQKLEDLFHQETANLGNIFVLKAEEISQVYPVDNYYDATGDELGHIPYQPEYFAALGTMIMRKIRSLISPAYKVIVLDCDGTLWKGVVGEDGYTGIEIDAPRKALQEFIVKQNQAGMLVCLASKNIENDVLEVFENRPDMPLQRQHLVAWKINWQDKSQNITALAQELNLGLDSFIFIDDNPVECAAMEAHCPQVLTLLLPEADKIETFIKHIWAFDRLKITGEDQKRTELYQQNIQREQLRSTSLTLEQFLANLDLQISISPLTDAQLNRVSQLTFRTNQFNFTTLRRSETELKQILAAGRECLVCQVKDRFGDYGLVGVIIFQTINDILRVDTFLLSCRVLGRGVEHKMLAKLGEIAQERGLTTVEIIFKPTAKNQPALDFLKTIGKEFQQTKEAGLEFNLPAEYTAHINYQPSTNNSTSETTTEKPVATVETPSPNTQNFHQLASQLWQAEDILNLIKSHQYQQQVTYTAPRTATEIQLSKIWQDILNVKQVGIADNFFSLGATSLQVTQLKWAIQQAFNIQLSLGTIFQEPSLQLLAQLIDTKAQEELTWNDLLTQIERLSEAEAQQLLEQNLNLLANLNNTQEADIKLSPSAYYCCGDVVRIPLQNKTELVYVKNNKNRAILSPESVAILLNCQTFKPIETHAREIRRQGQINLTLDNIKKQLIDLAEKGFLITQQQILDTYHAAKNLTETPPPISSLGMFTFNRPTALARGLKTYLENNRNHGRNTEFAVMDDTKDSQIQLQNKQIIQELKQEFKAKISYAGWEQKQAYAQALINTSNVPEEVVNFAILSGALGANRNCLALHTVGENMISVDDDTLCQIAIPSHQENTLNLTAKCDPGNLQTFPNRHSALQSVEYVQKDLLEIHEILLGKTIAQVINQLGENTQIITKQADANLINRLKTGNEKILITRTGIIGDCAWRAPFGYLGKPYGYLLLDGIAHDNLVQSESHYRQACSTREITRMVNCLTLSDDTVPLGAFWGLDNRELLPPFMPVIVGGEDFLFGSLLWICSQNSVFGNLPWGCVHQPVETRRFSPGEIFRTASGFDTSKLLMACIKSLNFQPHENTPQQRMQALGNHLMAIATPPLEEYEKTIRLWVLKDHQEFISLAENRLAQYNHTPEYWANDVKKYLKILTDSLTRSDYITPLDLVAQSNVDEARLLGKELVFKFGQLLYWWPEIVNTAKQLKQQGIRLGSLEI